MYVGIFGDVVFSVGHLRVLTPSNFKGKIEANWAEHEVLKGKSKPEFLNPKLREYECDILLDSSLGVNPSRMKNRLEEMVEKSCLERDEAKRQIMNKVALALGSDKADVIISIVDLPEKADDGVEQE